MSYELDPSSNVVEDMDYLSDYIAPGGTLAGVINEMVEVKQADNPWLHEDYFNSYRRELWERSEVIVEALSEANVEQANEEKDTAWENACRLNAGLEAERKEYQECAAAKQTRMRQRRALNGSE